MAARKTRRHPATRAPFLAIAALVTMGTVVSSPSDPARAQIGERPNILIIVTDDQRADAQSMAVMPQTRELFEKGGTRFGNAVTTTSLCCPSRASIFSGKYMHNHQIRTNSDGATYDAIDTIQHELGEAGYLRAFSGKYMNFFEQDPPFWDRWAQQISLRDEGYFDTLFNVDGKHVTAEYATTFTGDKALDFMESFEQRDDVPWLLFVAPYAPHKPAKPHPRYAKAKLPRWDKTPAFFERGKELDDKPPVIREQKTSLADVRRIRQNQLRSLMSVDDIVGQIFARMDDLEERNTLAFFMSDNGFLWYEHELEGKRHPYSGSVRIPLYMRWPGHVAEGATPDRIVANIDVAPTVYEAAGVQPSYVVDGRSLFRPVERERILIEYVMDDVGVHAGTYSGFWSPRTKYTEYDNGFREYYGPDDPYELHNLLHNVSDEDDPADADALSALLQIYKACAGPACL